jgi:hypothetical protein
MSYQVERAPTDVISKAIRLWGLRIPPNIRTSRAERLLGDYDAAIDGLSGSDHLDDDVVRSGLIERKSELQVILDRRHQREVERAMKQAYPLDRRTREARYA